MNKDIIDKISSINEEITNLDEKLRELNKEKTDLFLNNITVDDYFKNENNDTFYKILSISQNDITLLIVCNDETYPSITKNIIHSYDFSYMLNKLKELATPEEFNAIKYNVLNKL